MLTLTLSANKLEKLLCPARFYYHAVLKRRPAGPSPGADAGSILHAGWAVMNREAMKVDKMAVMPGELMPSPDDALATERASRPLAMRGEKPDYCTLEYLREAFSVLRAEWATFLPEWRVLEVERRGTRTLYEATMHVQTNWVPRLGGLGKDEMNAAYIGNDTLRLPVAISYEFVRDVVLQNRTTGEIWIADLKTASEDRRAEVAAWETSDQFKGYLWAWNDEHPDQPAAGVQPVRLILRPPLLPTSKPRNGSSKPRHEVSFPAPLRWGPEFIDEWKRSVLDRAESILRRNPDDPADWPLIGVSGTCNGPWGTCGYLATCRLTPASRLTHLSTDLYEHSDVGKPSADAVPQPTPEPALTP